MSTANDSACNYCSSVNSGLQHQQHYNQPQLYFPSKLFNQGMYSPTLCFNVITREINQEYVQTYELLSVKEESSADRSPARITIQDISNRLCVNLIARYMRMRLEFLHLHYTITSDSMTRDDINAAITDPAQDPRQPYMVNHRTPAQIIVQGACEVIRILHSDIGSFLTRQLHGCVTMCPEMNHFLIESITQIV